MASVLINLDEATFKALNQVAPPGKRLRSSFLRDAIRQAVRKEMERQSRAGYEAYPDSEFEADDWSTAEEFKK
jgi:metal-responsive CopG/Arc/MetJ family transcriptional regulator